MWIVALASLIGLSACNNEREEAPNTNIDSSGTSDANDNIQSNDAQANEITPVKTSQNNENATDTSTDNRGSNKEQAYYSGADSA